ncbi:MAG: 16S rRNA (adenine(1518)-N(6)/adenine(1519)-N(6))-dimethyltransferase RsmA [Synergistales bacterium]|nr:16S rRNA (adenine(1518)-N(6)/adenine(1519)-N(6))-dimethyltransferase RsmA [Synergistales bacterium]
MPESFLRPNTRIGQNFLVDKNILGVILDSSDVGPGDVVLEVGAGKGVLTEGLLERGASLVHSLEIDRRLEPFLDEIRTRYSNLRILWGDALKGGLPIELDPPPNKMIANIPYHITTPLIWKVLELYSPVGLRYMLLMVQKVAAEKICAPARSKDRYPLGVTIHAMGEARILRRVPPEVFNPSPEVTSALLEITITKGLELPGDKVWRTLIRSAFSHRRKTLLNNLAALLPGTRHEKAALLEKAGLSVSSRAEELELKHWSALLEILSPLIQGEKRQGTKSPLPANLKP